MRAEGLKIWRGACTNRLFQRDRFGYYFWQEFEGTLVLLEPSIPTALHSLDVDSGKSAVLWILIEHSPGAINTINGVFIDRQDESWGKLANHSFSIYLVPLMLFRYLLYKGAFNNCVDKRR